METPVEVWLPIELTSIQWQKLITDGSTRRGIEFSRESPNPINAQGKIPYVGAKIRTITRSH